MKSILRHTFSLVCLTIATASCSTAAPDSATGGSTPGENVATASSALSSGFYKIINKSTGKALGVADCNTAPLTLADQFEYWGAQCQQWNVVFDSSGRVTLQNTNSGNVLGIRSCDPSDYNFADQYPDMGIECQRWNVTLSDDGLTYLIQNRSTLKYLGVHDCQDNDFNNADQYEYTGVTCQRWSFVPLSTPQPKPLSTFDYQGVTLLDPTTSGRVWNPKQQFWNVRSEYLSFTNSDLLNGFQQRLAGLPPNGNLGGWYGSDFFHNFGQILSGLARMCAVETDGQARAKVNALVAGWGATIESDGYFFYTNAHKVGSPAYNAGIAAQSPYVYDKMVGGLVDAYHYCGNTQALTYLSQITTWAQNNLANTTWGVSDISQGKPFYYDMSEWYTLTENILRANMLTGVVSGFFGNEFAYSKYWNSYVTNQDPLAVMPWTHAYSHVNTLSGAAASYDMFGHSDYLATLTNAHAYLVANQIQASGGYGPDENLVHDSTEHTCRLTKNHASFETPCGSWGGMKMSKALTRFTGQATYGDWVELLLFNGIGATLPLTPDGHTHYYSDYNLGGGTKSYYPSALPCCAGTRPQAVADYHDQIFYQSSSGLYVSQFLPAQATFPVDPATTATVQQTTDFPYADSVQLTVTSLASPKSFRISIRPPAWLNGTMTATVNGASVALPHDSYGWAYVSRTWSVNDVLVVNVPQGFYAEKLPGVSGAYPAAIMHGPVMLAFNSPSYNPSTSVNFSNPSASLVPVPGQPLHYTLASDPSVTVKPYFEYAQGQSYFVYLDPTNPKFTVANTSLSYSGPWSDAEAANDDFDFVNQTGASFSGTGPGTAVELYAYQFDDAGKVDIYIDGVLQQADFDLYNAQRNTPVRWCKSGLAPGSHTMKVISNGHKNAASSNTYANVHQITFNTSCSTCPL